MKKSSGRRKRGTTSAQRLDPAAEFLRVAPAALLIGMGRTQFWHHRKNDPTFPRPIALGQRAIAFRKSELLAWAEGRRV